ncbi:MAG: Threonylcarbamoyl-AMP synthase [Chlamydiae bacterium]|nr:Threonylcarbamoyl-AMP synthase [Chlamydiota bacterium]
MFVNLEKAKKILKNGEVLAVPTETVFGMAVDMFSEKALLNLYNLKGRALNKPFVIQLAYTKDIYPFLFMPPFDLEKLIKTFWPGPLTIVLPVRKEMVSGLLRAKLPTAAFRVTQNQFTRELIKAYGDPLAITSANKSGENSLLSPKEIEREFGEEFPILKTDQSEMGGIPSTILAYFDASWVVLRMGDISLKQLYPVLGYYPPVVSNVDYEKNTYLLRPQLHLRDCSYDGSIKVVLGFDERKYPSAEEVIKIGSINKPTFIKKNICSLLQKIHKLGHPHIWVDMNFPKEGKFKELVTILERASKDAI